MKLGNANPKTTVMHVVEAFGGGVAHGIAGICEGMSAHVQSVVVHGSRDFEPDLRARLASTEFIPWAAEREIGRSDAVAFRQLRAIIKSRNPEVIHLHSSKAGALGRLACLFTGRRLLYTPHSYSFLRRDISPLKRSVFRFAEQLLANRAITVACGLEEYSNALTMGRRVTLVPNTVKFDIFQRRGHAKAADRATVVAVGRICPQKDFEFFRAVVHAMPELDFLWVSGSHGEERRSERNLSVLGKVSPQDLAALFESSQVFINTSLWEGLSKAVIEACAMGLPLVLRNVPGNRELPYLGADATLFDSVDQCVLQIRAALDTRRSQAYSQRNINVATRVFNYGGSELETLYHAEAYIAQLNA